MGPARARTPTGEESEIEIRQVFEVEDFGDELTPELREQDARAARADRGSSGAEWASRDAHRAIDAVWRIESGRLIAGLARMVRDVGLAEDLAQDALVAALETWPRVGRPGQPGRLADGHGEEPRDRPDAAQRAAREQARRSSRATSGS